MMKHYGNLGIFNVGQGSQVNKLEAFCLLKGNGTQISIDGNDCLRDNVFMGRLWRNNNTKGFSHTPTTVSVWQSEGWKNTTIRTDHT